MGADPRIILIPPAQKRPQEPDGGVGVRQQLVLRPAALWRPTAFQNSCLVTSAPAESKCRSCSHIPQTPAGEQSLMERGAETAEGVTSSATTHPDWGSGCGSAPNQPLRLPVPPQDDGLLTRWAPWGVITHLTQQGLSPCSVTCWLQTLVKLHDLSKPSFPS